MAEFFFKPLGSSKRQKLKDSVEFFKKLAAKCPGWHGGDDGSKFSVKWSESQDASVKVEHAELSLELPSSFAVGGLLPLPVSGIVSVTGSLEITEFNRENVRDLFEGRIPLGPDARRALDELEATAYRIGRG